MSRGRSPDRRQAGFSLPEVLVALAVTTICLTAVAQVSGQGARAVRAVENRAGLVQTARAVETGIPARTGLVPGRIDGEVAGHRWRMDVLALDVDGAAAGARWVPRHVVTRVRAPTGEMLTLDTVRLAPRGAP